MQLRSITIKNYRSFDATGVNIRIRELAAFVGKNSSGKSNILQALQLFFSNAPITEDDIYFANATQTVTIGVELYVPDNEVAPGILPFVSKKGILSLAKEYSLLNTKGAHYSHGRFIYRGNSNMDPFPNKRIAEAKMRTFWDSSDAAPLHSYLHEELSTAKYYEILGWYWCDHINEFRTEWNQDTIELDSKQTKSIYDILPAYYYLPVGYSASEALKDRHSYFQQIYQQILGDINAVLASAQAEKLKKQVANLYKDSGMQKRCNDINAVLDNIGGADSTVRMRIEIGEPDYTSLLKPAPTLKVDDGYDCDVQNKGQGIQRDAIFRLLRVFSQLKKDNKVNFILAVDEPEAFMHPTYKRSLYKSFLSLCSSGCQVLYTTHDPAFVSVNRFDDIHTVFRQNTEKPHSLVHNCSLQTLMEKKAFSDTCKGKTEAAIRKEIEHKCHGEQNEGFFADRVVLVEGATELYALPVYLKKLGYDLDENNTVIIQAESVTLLILLCSIFSACRIPCYCIFDGDKPPVELYEHFMLRQIGKYTPKDDSEKKKLDAVKKRIQLNHNLLSFLRGIPVDFPATSSNMYYTVWERDFEHAIQMEYSSYSKSKDSATKKEGIPKDSKPLVAYHLAQKSKLSEMPSNVKTLLTEIIDNIKKVTCLPLENIPPKYPQIIRCDEDDDGAIPVFSSAAGRNTYSEGDIPNYYVSGSFPTGTSYLVHIQGDSMEKAIPNGAFVAVRQSEEFPPQGKMGIFMLDGGEMVCKLYLVLPTGEHLLKSYNDKYPPIPVTEDICCRGHVIMLGAKTPAIYMD